MDWDNLLIIFCLTVGIYFILLGMILPGTPKKIIEYRYIPRTLQEEQQDPLSILDFYDQMFQNRNLLVH